jgi:hypothetical protein
MTGCLPPISSSWSQAPWGLWPEMGQRCDLTVLASWLVKLLLVYASTVIPGFSHLEIHDQDVYSLLDRYVFRNGASSSTIEGWSFYVGTTFVAPYFLHEFMRTVMASRPLWTPCILCHCTIPSNIYKRYTEVSCQWGLVQQVMPEHMQLRTLKLQLVCWTVIALTTAKFKPLILPMSGSFLSNTT